MSHMKREETDRGLPIGDLPTDVMSNMPTNAERTNATTVSVPCESVETESCSAETMPDLIAPAADQNTREVFVPVLTSMTKVLFDGYRLQMYSCLNLALRSGTLEYLTGEMILDKRINAKNCEFPEVTYWRIDRDSFYADVEVNLKLTTQDGFVSWKGCLVCLCGFDEELYVRVNGLVDFTDGHAEGLDQLSRYLVPYNTNRRVDKIAEELWERYLPEALTEPKKRSAVELARRMGLTIQYHPIYDHGRMIDSAVFFKDDTLSVGDDRVEKAVGDDGKEHEKHIKAETSTPVIIPANTIVVNTNRINRSYSAFHIYHECYHFDEHYLFFCLQELGSNDMRRMPTEKVVVSKDKVIRDDVYFMEMQANRGAYGLMMPRAHTDELIREECRKVTECRNSGDKFEKAGIAIGKALGLPYFRVKARMIQLGNIEAKGSLNYVRKEKIEPFAFYREAWQEEQHTFVVDDLTVEGLRRQNADLDALFKSGRYVYADGHVVRNETRFVTKKEGELFLTEEALKRVDNCCLRFARFYIQRNVGSYVFGRMYCDTEYIKQTEFYLSDILNKNQIQVAKGITDEIIDDLRAKELFIEKFPKDFKKAVEGLKKKNKVSDAKLAEYFNTDDSTFSRWLSDPKRYRNEDFLTLLCLYFKLPDWISRLLIKRAKFQFDDEDRRQQALLHILRAQSCDGKDAANDYLKRHGLAVLAV